jgi:hypothetical protein
MRRFVIAIVACPEYRSLAEASWVSPPVSERKKEHMKIACLTVINGLNFQYEHSH